MNCRMETVSWGRIYGQCKILGVVLCVGGAVVLSLYQGPSLQLLHWHFLLELRPGGSFVSFHGEEVKTLVQGPLLMFIAFIAWSTWVIMQVICNHHCVSFFQFWRVFPGSQKTTKIWNSTRRHIWMLSILFFSFIFILFCMGMFRWIMDIIRHGTCWPCLSWRVSILEVLVATFGLCFVLKLG